MGILFSCCMNANDPDALNDSCFRSVFHKFKQQIMQQTNEYEDITDTTTESLQDTNSDGNHPNLVLSTSEDPSLPDLCDQLFQLILSSDQEDVCPTCLEDYDPSNPKIVTQCCHHFHLSCIYAWMERSNTCPICLRVMLFDEAAA